jgi:3-carboxy-cis,cis-muconate cycloisomerase
VRPSSSTSEPFGGEPAGRGLFDGILARGAVRGAVSDRSWLQAMLDVEAALARALAEAGLMPAEDAEAIARACRAEAFDIEALGRDAAESGNPVVPLVRALTAAVGHPAAGHVHRGATSQDVLDTAAMLVARRALGPLLVDLRASADAAAGLAEAHRGTLVPARTLLQHALPTTFGLKAAMWMAGLDAAADRLEEVRATRLAAQLGGAAGTLASLQADGPAVLAAMVKELGLAEPLLPWHTERSRIAELAGALGQAAGSVAKPARDVILLAQTEVAEVREGTPRRGGSSTLPHKHNPIAAVTALACARRAPGLVATLLSAMAHEHERAAGGWHAEWLPLRDLLSTVGAASAWLRDCLEHLEVDAPRMRSNLALSGGLLLAERVTAALTPALGRLVAHDAVERATADAAATGRSFEAAVADLSEVREHLTEGEIADLFDPSTYLGSAHAFVERAVAAHRDRSGPGRA